MNGSGPAIGDRAHELRVHGVAGTPPEAMLQLDAVPVRPRSGRPVVDEITEWRTPPTDDRLRAWRWSSLTSGRWYQAFYLLLLPFMIANLAGWMLPGDPGAPVRGGDPTGPPPYRTPRLRLATLLVRLVGLLVTAVFVVSVQIAVADLVVWQWLYLAEDAPLWLVGLGTALTAAVFGGLVGLTRIRPRRADGLGWMHRAREQWRAPRDPVGIGFLGRAQWVLWNSGSINVALRRLHLTAGLAVVGLLAALPVGGTSQPGLRLTALVLAVVALAAVVVLAAWIGLRRGLDVGRGPDPAAAGPSSDAGDPGLRLPFALIRWVIVAPAVAALAIAALLPLSWSEPVVRTWTSLPALRGTAVWVTVAVVVLVLLLLPLTGHGRRTVTPAAVLLLSASIAAAFGAGLISRAAGLVGGLGDFRPEVDQFVAWLAVAVTTSLAVVLVVGTVRWLVAVRRIGSAAAWHVLTGRASWLTALMGATGLALTVVLAVQVRTGAPVSALPGWFALVVVLALLLPPLVVAGVLLARRPAVVAGLVVGALVVGVAVGWAVRAGQSLRVAGIDVPPPTFAEFCLAVAVVLPTAAILGRIYAGLTSQGARRGVGILWDVGTFWPRWFHPLAPPTYSDRAVPALAERIRAEEALLLAPHSQGAVIAKAALLLDDEPLGHVALLSYGSPWGHLYAEFFPAHVTRAATTGVSARVGGRWTNLWRDSDPIGGPVEGVERLSALVDPEREGHSEYWIEPAYRETADALRARLDERPLRGEGLATPAGG